LREVNALAADADRIYAATARGLLVQKRGTDAWATKTIAHGLPDNGVQRLFFDGGRLFLRCASALASSEDGGETFRVWAITDYAKIAELAATGAKLFATFKETSGIFFSPDAGKTWVPRAKPGDFPDLADRGSGHDVRAIAAGNGAAVVLTRGGIVRYADDGRARRAVPPERHRHPGDFLARGGRTLYTGIGIWSELYASDDEGETWTARTTGGSGMNATAAAGDGFSFVSRKLPELRLSTDRGVTFSRTVPFDALGCARSDSSQSYLLAAGPGPLAFACDGIVQTTPDEGASFRRYDVGKGRVTALAVADGRIVAATSERAILVSVDGGRTFAPVSPPPFVASFLAASGDQVAVGSSSAQVAYSADAGKSWHALGPSAGLGNSFVRALAFDGPRLWVGTAGGLFLGRPAAP
jgi:hypothetical protein